MPRGRKRVLPLFSVDKDFDEIANILDSSFHGTVQQMLAEKYQNLYQSLSELYNLSIQENLNEAAERALEQGDKLMNLQEAWNYLREHGINETYKSFAGKVARGTFPSFLFGDRLYVLKSELDFYIQIQKNFITVRELYERLKQHWPDLRLRSLIGRVEKGSIPSIKIFGKRLISKEVADALVKVARDYMSIPDAYAYIVKKGGKIKRNAFERRVDRGIIPHIKVGGRRYIPKYVVEHIAELEGK